MLEKARLLSSTPGDDTSLDENDCESIQDCSEGDFDNEPVSRKSRRLNRYSYSVLLACTLALSIGINLILGAYILFHDSSDGSGLPAFNVTVPLIPVKSQYTDHSNLTAVDRQWQSLDTSTGFVALDKGQQNMFPSDPFPWDSSKEVYLLSGYHSLHCLRVIYFSFRRLHDNETLEYSFEHVLHCINTIRSDITCNADPTPLAMNSHDAPGRSHNRQCRDWAALESHALGISACYKGVDPGEPGHDTIAEWTHCPEGSPYEAAVKSYLAGSAAE